MKTYYALPTTYGIGDTFDSFDAAIRAAGERLAAGTAPVTIRGNGTLGTTTTERVWIDKREVTHDNGGSIDRAVARWVMELKRERGTA